MSEDVQTYGFDADVNNVAEVCANIMFQIINFRAEGKDDDVTTLTIRRKETGKLIKNIAPATIERRGDKLHICGEEILIRKGIYPEDEKKGLKCFQAVCDAYAEVLKIKDRVVTRKISRLSLTGVRKTSLISRNAISAQKESNILSGIYLTMVKMNLNC